MLRVRREVLYFWTRRMPPEVATGEARPEYVTTAYRAFRRELKGRGGSSRGKKPRSQLRTLPAVFLNARTMKSKNWKRSASDSYPQRRPS